ncbi:MAG: PAS domain-containing protein [Alphaproteobacteria bacterium]|nr:PAS domain-containing protein [Alphaproteobacteria bacterium]
MPTRYRSIQTETDHDRMRCVVDENGKLVFASPAVGWALGVNAAFLSAKPASTVLSVVSNHKKLHKPFSFPNIPSGFYEVALLRQERDPLLLQARIDRINAPNGRKYAVVWLDPDRKMQCRKNGDFNQAAHDFATFIVDNQKKPVKEKTTHIPDLGHISKDDGELRHFFSLTNDLLGVYRRDGSFVRVNPTVSRVLGYPDAELKLLPFIEIIHPDDRKIAQAATKKMLQASRDQEIRVNFESRARCKDGSIRWMKWVHKTAGDHIYIVGRDVTDIKQHEAELEWREAQLSEAQKIGHMGHWYWEVDQHVMEWSDQIYSIFGVKKERFSATVDNISNLLLKSDIKRTYKAFQRAFVRKKDYELEFRLRRPKGGIRYIHCEGRCKLDPKTGKVKAMFGIMQDITEHKLHERALQKAKEEAETAYDSKTRFLANMSHELRTPLNAIIGFSEMIQRQLLGPVGNTRYLDYIGGINESGEHLLNLINDILDMSKIEIGKYELYVEKINVGKLVRLAVYMIEGRAHEAQVRLITDNISDDVQIIADRRALMQILLNLMSNAVKFTPAEGFVDIGCRYVSDGVEIVVQDTGVGIPKSKIGIVTIPFEQVDSAMTRKREGSGLGLSITKNLIKLHGGTLKIESKVEVGTTVTVLLPKNPPASKNVKTVLADPAQKISN